MSGIKRFRHPEVGEFEAEFEALQLPDDSGQRIMTYTATPDSPAEAAPRASSRAHGAGVVGLDGCSVADVWVRRERGKA